MITRLLIYTVLFCIFSVFGYAMVNSTEEKIKKIDRRSIQIIIKYDLYMIFLIILYILF